MHFSSSLDDYLPLIEFSYSNSYHSNIRMALFEGLYDIWSSSPYGCFVIGVSFIIDIDIIYEALEKVRVIRTGWLLITVSRILMQTIENGP